MYGVHQRSKQEENIAIMFPLPTISPGILKYTLCAKNLKLSKNIPHSPHGYELSLGSRSRSFIQTGEVNSDLMNSVNTLLNMEQYNRSPAMICWNSMV